MKKRLLAALLTAVVTATALVGCGGEKKSNNKLVISTWGLSEDLLKENIFTPFEVIKERWYKRAASRGKTGKAADMQFANVNETAQTYIRPAHEISDIVLNGVVSAEYIEEVTSKIYREIRAAVLS